MRAYHSYADHTCKQLRLKTASLTDPLPAFGISVHGNGGCRTRHEDHLHAGHVVECLGCTCIECLKAGSRNCLNLNEAGEFCDLPAVRRMRRRICQLPLSYMQGAAVICTASLSKQIHRKSIRNANAVRGTPTVCWSIALHQMRQSTLSLLAFFGDVTNCHRGRRDSRDPAGILP